jgi:carboxyl-terminal processing protease
MSILSARLWTAVLLCLPVSLAWGYSSLKPEKSFASIDRDVVEQFQEQHYARSELDDGFSRKVLDLFIDRLDGTHSIFLAKDVDRFRSRYGNELDNQLKKGDLGAAFDIYNTFRKRRIEIDEWLMEQIDAGVNQLDLTNAESFTVDRAEEPWPDNEAGRRALWLKQLESQVIDMRLSDMDDEDIQKRLRQRYENEINQLEQTNATDAFGAYMSAYAQTYDPHTDYLSPRQSEEFDINMNLSLHGIGAELRYEDGYAEIVRLIPGGPASKSGRLSPTDRIVAVGQGKGGEFTDVVGMRLDDTVRLIRGEIGSTVRLQILPSEGGEIDTIALVRDKIELKEQAASSRVLDVEHDGHTSKVGVIRLPMFYNGTADDVKRLLNELKEKDVTGVVMDLRNNGGGSLGEVVDLVGLFMGAAPAVQIKDADGGVQIAGNRSARAAFSGPLAVLVNRLSASASEIFAAAIQDYGRGIILGSQTFGKGTVQSVMPLSRDDRRGRLTLTQAKFYRITGDSTQLHGVRPDIHFPSFVDPELIGEDTLPHALPWDEIDAINFPAAPFIEHSLPVLKKRHEQRAADDAEFRYMVDRIELARERNSRKAVSLVLAKRQTQQEQLREKRLALVNQFREATGKPPFETFQAFQDSEKEDDPQDSVRPDTSVEEDDDPDAYQKEAAHILLDMVEIFGKQMDDQSSGQVMRGEMR